MDQTSLPYRVYGSTSTDARQHTLSLPSPASMSSPSSASTGWSSEQVTDELMGMLDEHIAWNLCRDNHNHGTDGCIHNHDCGIQEHSDDGMGGNCDELHQAYKTLKRTSSNASQRTMFVDWDGSGVPVVSWRGDENSPTAATATTATTTHIAHHTFVIGEREMNQQERQIREGGEEETRHRGDSDFLSSRHFPRRYAASFTYATRHDSLTEFTSSKQYSYQHQHECGRNPYSHQYLRPTTPTRGPRTQHRPHHHERHSLPNPHPHPSCPQRRTHKNFLNHPSSLTEKLLYFLGLLPRIKTLTNKQNKKSRRKKGRN